MRFFSKAAIYDPKSMGLKKLVLDAIHLIQVEDDCSRWQWSSGIQVQE